MVQDAINHQGKLLNSPLKRGCWINISSGRGLLQKKKIEELAEILAYMALLPDLAAQVGQQEAAADGGQS